MLFVIIYYLFIYLYLLVIVIVIIIGSIYFILIDELVIGSVQRRIGPFNVGWYGIPSSIINGCNLIITQLILPKLHFYFGFNLFPLLFFIISFINYIIIYPFYLINLILSIICFIFISGLSILFIILSSFSGNSKYSMLGCIRIISQLISLELIFTTILLFFIISFNEISIAGFLVYSIYCCYLLLLIIVFIVILLIQLLFIH